MASEVLDPREELLRIVDRFRDLLQRLDQAHDVRATYLSDLHEGKVEDSVQCVIHDTILVATAISCILCGCARFYRK